MKKTIILLALIVVVGSKAYTQRQLPNSAIYLTDGSYLKGTLLDTLHGLARVRLSDNSVIDLPTGLISHIRQGTDNELLLEDGRVLLQSGLFSSLSFQVLSAHRSSSAVVNNNSLRWGIGAHYVSGYQFHPKFALGLGIGIDAHEYFFMPVFLDVRGALIKNREKKPDPSDRAAQWFGGNFHRKRSVPFSYNLQVGYQFPVEGMFGNENVEEIKGGWMVFPSIGVLFPSRRGPAFRLDVGYKFQKYSRSFESPSWNGWGYRDKVLLKSFSTRASWVF